MKFWKQAEVDPDVDAFTAAVVLVHVHSRGSVRLRSADPTWAPAIDAGYLTDERDLDALVSGVEKAREIASAGPLAAVLAEEWSPGGTVRGRDDAARSRSGTTLESLYHPVGSCRMGTDDDAVVDPQLRVRGIEGLRVVDASVMPTLVRGNTNAPTIMIAERAADLIPADARPALPPAPRRRMAGGTPDLPPLPEGRLGRRVPDAPTRPRRATAAEAADHRTSPADHGPIRAVPDRGSGNPALCPAGWAAQRPRTAPVSRRGGGGGLRGRRREPVDPPSGRRRSIRIEIDAARRAGTARRRRTRPGRRSR